MPTRRLIYTKWGRTLCMFAVLGVLSYFSDRSEAAEALPQPASSGIWQSLSDRALDKLRGGFDMGSGLLVSFGITRAVYINGALVTETTLSVGQLSQLTPAQATALGSQLSGMGLLQNGPGNSVQSGFSGAAAGTIIQNTLDNQQINVQTLINASSNGLGIIRSLNLQDTLNDALSRSAATR